MEAKRCMGCRFWKNLLPKIDENSIGECRFGPPELHPSPDHYLHGTNNGFWPQTYGKDWCGKQVGKEPGSRVG